MCYSNNVEPRKQNMLVFEKLTGYCQELHGRFSSTLNIISNGDAPENQVTFWVNRLELDSIEQEGQVFKGYNALDSKENFLGLIPRELIVYQESYTKGNFNLVKPCWFGEDVKLQYPSDIIISTPVFDFIDIVE